MKLTRTAILAVLATSAGGPEGVMLMELSWYMVMLSFLAFLLMVLVNVLSGHAVADEEVRASRTHSHSPLPGASFASRGAQPESQAPRIVAFDDSPRPTPAPAPYP